jgi:hypothetical protein
VPIRGGLRLGPTEAAVVLRNGRVVEVRRAGKYKRLFTSDTLPKTGTLEALYFHVGEVAMTVKVGGVPVEDDFHVDWSLDVGLRWIGGDDTLKSVAERYSADNLAPAIESELRASVSAMVRQAASLASHDELSRSMELESLFRSGRRLLQGALEIVAVRRAAPAYDPKALAEIEERKQHRLDKARATRKHELALGNAESGRILRLLDAETSAAVKAIEEGSRASIAAGVARELGVPAWWVYNPAAHAAEISANKDLLIQLLGKHGTEFGMLSEQFGLSREDFLQMFSGFQSGVLEVVQAQPQQIPSDSVIDGTIARDDDPDSPRYANSELLRSVLLSQGHERDIAGTALHIGAEGSRAIIVAQEVGSLRADTERIARAISAKAGTDSTELAVAPYKVRIGDQLESIATSIAADAGVTPAIGARREAEGQYLLTSPNYELLVLEPWRESMELVFDPRLRVKMKVE